MNKTFEELKIAPAVLQGLTEMGFTHPTPVQSKVIPHVMDKTDLIVIAKTGSGKTAAFGIPMLQMLHSSADGPQGLILTPTRELAVQVDSDIQTMGKHLAIRTTAIYGQHNINLEVEALAKGATIVVGTPGRVFDHIRQKTLITKNIKFLVLDEADRMLDMGFIDQVTRIVKTLPTNRITLLFSATIPQEIRHICRQHMKNPETIEIASPTKTVDSIEQIYYRIERNEKRTQLNRILLKECPDSCLIFCNTRIEVDRVQEFLSKKGYASCALHGDIPQSKRLRTIHGFKHGKFRLLVATDVAARGIHVDDLSLVINYDVPNEQDNYVHRIGRTGRAGSGGRAITLVTGDDIMSLYDIEEHINAMIREEEPPTAEEIEAIKSSSDAWIKSMANQPSDGARPRETKNAGPNKFDHSRHPRPRTENTAPSAAGPAQGSKQEKGVSGIPKKAVPSSPTRAKRPIPVDKDKPSSVVTPRPQAKPVDPKPSVRVEAPPTASTNSSKKTMVFASSQKKAAPPAPEKKKSLLEKALPGIFGKKNK